MGNTCCNPISCGNPTISNFSILNGTNEDADLNEERKACNNEIDNVNQVAYFQTRNSLSNKVKSKHLSSNELESVFKKRNTLLNENEPKINKEESKVPDQLPIPYGYFKRGNTPTRKEDLNSIESDLSACPCHTGTIGNGFKVNPSHFRQELKGNIKEKYEFMDTIGKGGYGVVKKIKNKVSQEIRAVKACVKSKCQVTKDFSDEITILQQLVFILISPKYFKFF